MGIDVVISVAIVDIAVVIGVVTTVVVRLVILVVIIVLVVIGGVVVVIVVGIVVEVVMVVIPVVIVVSIDVVVTIVVVTNVVVTTVVDADSVVLVVGTAAHGTLLTTLVSIVTAPVCAKALPFRVAPVFKVMLASARIFPTNAVVVPRVAELPTCQNTLQTVPPLITLTDEPLAVMSVLSIRKMKTALGLPSASRVRVPVNPADPVI